LVFSHHEFGGRLPFQNIGGKVFGQADKLARGENIGYLNGLVKTDHLGNGSGFDPDQEEGPSNAHHGGGGPYLKIFFLEFQQVLGEHPDLSKVHFE